MNVPIAFILPCRWQYRAESPQAFNGSTFLVGMQKIVLQKTIIQRVCLHTADKLFTALCNIAI